ncbi:MAG: Nif3-like dinuclear metal center hexameric protein [Planctomycetes bacterium]|nr:Nif3-like dinuclear metal center hexameric protein [Planctomycetota bacterium]
MSTVADFMSALQSIAPLALAADWDNVGLLLGDSAAPVQRVMTCLTVTAESVAEAIETRAHLIISHHPILFRAIQQLTTANAEGRMALDLVRAGVAVYSAHTAYDNCAGGINDQLAARIGLTDVGPLRYCDAAAQCKIAVFVPEHDLKKVSDAMFTAGAGHIGQYRECSFRLAGTGTFFGSEATNPTLGVKGQREEVAEWRLEVVCAEHAVDAVVAALRHAHSYEEPAFDVYPLRPMRAPAGEGRLGVLPAAMSLGAFAQLAKTALGASWVQIVGAPEQSVRRVTIACGAAGEFFADAAARQADVFLTGEMRFHDCLAAQTKRIAVVLPGHYATERLGMETLADRLQARFPDATVWPSRRERDPLLIM